MSDHHIPPSGSALRRLAITLATTGILAAAHGPAHAEEDTAGGASRDRMLELLEKLKEKGVITEEELGMLTTETPDERMRRRAEQRKKAQREAEEQQKVEVAKDRFLGRFNNGISFETPDRRSGFTLGGRVHTDYRHYSQDTAASTFDMRRAYLTMQGKWNDYLTWDVTGDFAQTTATQLDVAWFNIAYSESLQLRLGQFKMPFSIEELSSSRFLDFQERSLVNGLVPQKERGMMLHGIPMPGVTYGVALSTGQGKNNNDLVAPRSNPDVVARVSVNLAELLDRQAMNVFHLGAAMTDGDLPTGFGLSQRTEARGLTFFNTAGFTGQDVHRRRYGIETMVAHGPVKFQAEFVQANYAGRSSAGTDFNRDINAYYGELLWMITGERYAEAYRNGVNGRIVPFSNFTPGSTDSWGAWEVGIRMSRYDASDFASTNPVGTGVLAPASAPTGNAPFASTPTNQATALTLGLKWYWNPNLKFYLNYTRTKFGTPETVNLNYGGASSITTDQEKAVTFRAALDF